MHQEKSYEVCVVRVSVFVNDNKANIFLERKHIALMFFLK